MNGQVLLDLPVNLSDGTRVTLLRYEAYQDPHPLVPYDREKEIEQIRAAIARMDAGGLGRDVDDVSDELEREIDAAEAVGR